MKYLANLKVQNKCDECQWRSDGFFCHLPANVLQIFEKLKITNHYPKRATIFMEGQPAKGIYMLCQGRVKISTCSQEGKIIILDIAEAGKILGLSATVSGAAHIASAEALEPCQINFIPKKEFLRFLETNNEATLSALKHLSEGYRASRQHSCSLGLSASTADKVATLFIGWCKTNAAKTDGNGTYHLKISHTHEEIAQMIGASRETVTRVLRDFRERNLIIRNSSGILIPDIKKLKAALGTRQGAGLKKNRGI